MSSLKSEPSPCSKLSRQRYEPCLSSWLSSLRNEPLPSSKLSSLSTEPCSFFWTEQPENWTVSIFWTEQPENWTLSIIRIKGTVASVWVWLKVAWLDREESAEEPLMVFIFFCWVFDF
jgi:hypothetical protein